MKYPDDMWCDKRPEVSTSLPTQPPVSSTCIRPHVTKANSLTAESHEHVMVWGPLCHIVKAYLEACTGSMLLENDN